MKKSISQTTEIVIIFPYQLKTCLNPLLVSQYIVFIPKTINSIPAIPT